MKIIGHRGARGLSPENTIASIEKAIEHGVDEVEVDVRMTKDHVAVLHHDSTLIDPSGTEVTIKHTTYAELLRHKPDLAALDHAIRVIGHRCPLIIEIKPKVNPEEIINIIRFYLAKGWRIEEFRVASFDYKILQQVRQALPDISIIVNEAWSSIRARIRCRKLGTRRISISQLALWRGFLKAMHKSGYKVSPFSINSVRRARKWRPYLYGAITDYPDRFEKK
jgi:glycerophosphoryl diester phosphodiesterase